MAAVALSSSDPCRDCTEPTGELKQAGFVRIEQLVPTQRVGSEWGLTKSIQNSPTLPAGWSVDALFHALFRGCRLANNSFEARKKVEAGLTRARRALLWPSQRR
jgi:hypothetical protein